MALFKVNINGRERELEGDLNLIEAARLLGVHIPHFCYHPGLGVDGNCRMCLVELEGAPKPVIACNTYVRELTNRDGTVRKVLTESPKAKEWQRGVLEFLFLNHPLDCPICDQSGECLLQDYYMQHGQYESRLDTPKVHKRKATPVGPRVMLDAERCVLCARCVRFCDQVSGTGELYIVNRGNRSEITTYPGAELDNDYSLNTVDICPVGALTSSAFRFKKRVWLLSSVHSICAGCARGCNTYLEHDEGIVYRLRPRENMQVNRYWMCDPGRATAAGLNEGRLEVPRRGETEAPSLKPWPRRPTGCARRR
jgi:NADH-quinone oxidoreductase subunit G